MDFLYKLGQNIKTIREENKLTQAQLAELADVSISTIARLEIGQGFSTLKTIEKIAKALKKDVEEIFDVTAIGLNNQDEFSKKFNKTIQALNTKKDYEFILEVIKAYIKTKN